MTLTSSLHVVGSVGKGARNSPTDVRAVQERLNALMGPSRERLAVDGICGAKTRAALRDFQKTVLNFKWPDERVDPGGKTLRALNDPNSATLWRRASLGRVHFHVPGHVPVIAQPTNMTCWAAAVTILISWRRGRTLTIAQAMATLGEPWITNFRTNIGLLWNQTATFARAAGLQVAPLQSFTVDEFALLLESSGGPLFVSIHPGGNAQNITHLIAVTGISGDGTADGTVIHYIDPFGGIRRNPSFREFHLRYENSSRSQLTVQILHY